MKAAVNKQPLAATIDASSIYWRSYKGGIISSPDCGTNSNYAVNIVGYGYTTQANCLICAYWIIVTSLGTSFGDSGTANIAMDPPAAHGLGATTTPGICGINQYVMTAYISK